MKTRSHINAKDLKAVFQLRRVGCTLLFLVTSQPIWLVWLFSPEKRSSKTEGPEMKRGKKLVS